jgi:D-alanine-D-alanine ligase
MKKLNIAVLFGGRAPEHEVSIITGIQTLHALIGAGYETLPVYISKEGRWFVGDKSFYDIQTFKNQEKAIFKKPQVELVHEPDGEGLIEKPGMFSFVKTLKKFEVDVFFPCFHGKYGEDGSIQGLLELMNIPYVGCNVQASAVGMDKALSKKIAKSIGIPTLADTWVNKGQAIKNPIKFPAFVKPARLGSSIGIKRVKNARELKEALEVAFFYDTKVLIEEALDTPLEVNISILGNNPYEVSATELPVSSGALLSFADKYISKEGRASKGMATAKRIIPAPIKKSTEKLIEDYSQKFFAEIDGTGIARIDYLVSKDEKKVYFNEINTIPGSLAFYLWKKKGLSFDKLVDKLVKLALEKAKQKEQLTTTFKSNILEGFSGAKAGKLKI